MGYYVTGFKDRGYFVHDSKRGETIWISNVQIRKLNPTFRNMTLRSHATNGKGLKKVPSNNKIVFKMDEDEAGLGKKRVLIYLDFESRRFGTVRVGEKEILWESFDKLPYYDKECEYTNLFFIKETGQVCIEYYALMGEVNTELYFRTYIQDAVERQVKDVVEIETSEEVESKDVVETVEAEVEDKEVSDVEEADETIEDTTTNEDSTDEEPKVTHAVYELINGGLLDTINIKTPAVEDMYKLILLSQGDDAIITVPYEVLRGIRFKIHSILDKNFDMSKYTTLSTVRIEDTELIIIVSIDRESKFTKVQIIKSARPEKEKIYDMEYIKENYFKWRSRNQYVR